MGNDTIDVGKNTPALPERSAEHPVSARFTPQQMGDHSRNRGAYAAMSQQGSDSGRGTQSTPQKLVQLVGYRDPKSCRESWIRPPSPVQR